MLQPGQDQSHKAIQQLTTVHIHSLPPEDQKKGNYKGTECFCVNLMKHSHADKFKMFILESLRETLEIWLKLDKERLDFTLSFFLHL